MPKLVNVVLPDGSVRAVPEDVARDSSYREELPTEAIDRAQLAQEQEATSGFWQGAKAFGEGALDSLSLGLLGPEEGSMGALRAEHRTGARLAGQIAGFAATLPVPGAGALGTVGKVARFTPAGAAASLGRGAAGVVGGANTLRGTVVAAGIEGGAQGAGAEIARARLSGDPTTVESVLGGVGRGALLAAGVGALGHGVLGVHDRASRAMRAGSEKEAGLLARLSDAESEVRAAHEAIDATRVARIKAGGVEDLTTRSGRAEAITASTRSLKGAEEAYATAKAARDGLEDQLLGAKDNFALLQRETEDVFVDIATMKAKINNTYTNTAQVVAASQDLVKQGEQLRHAVYLRPAAGGIKGRTAAAEAINADVGAVDTAKGILGRAIESGDTDAIVKAHNQYASRVRTLAKKSGMEVPNLPGAPKPVADETLRRALKFVPKDLLAFSKVRPETIAVINNTLMRHPAGKEVLGRFQELSNRVGAAEGSDFVSLHRHIQDLSSVAHPKAKDILRAEADTKALLKEAKDKHNEVLREHERLVKRADAQAEREAKKLAQMDLVSANARLRVAKEQRKAISDEVRAMRSASDEGGGGWGLRGYVGGVVGSAVIAPMLGGGTVGHAAGYFLGSRVAGGRMSWVTKVRETARKALASRAVAATGRGIKVSAPVTEALRMTLQGLPDSEKDLRKAALNRSREILAMQDSVRDISYSLLRDHAKDNPEFIHAVHNALSGGVEWLAKRVPQDPGGAMRLGKSSWMPTEAQMHELATILNVYHSPLDAMNRMLSGEVDPAASDAMWALYPGMMKEAAREAEMIVQEHGDNMTLAQVAGLSQAFRMPMDSLLYPENVAYFAMQDKVAMGAAAAAADAQAQAQSPSVGGRPPAAPAASRAGKTMTQQLSE